MQMLLGGYADRKTATYTQEADEPIITRTQVKDEKAHIYAPIKQ